MNPSYKPQHRRRQVLRGLGLLLPLIQFFVLVAGPLYRSHCPAGNWYGLLGRFEGWFLKGSLPLVHESGLTADDIQTPRYDRYIVGS